MPAFNPSGTISQSLDGNTLSFTDTSNYSDNTEGIALNSLQSRSLILKDGKGNSLGSVIVPAGENSVDFEIEQDHFFDITLSWVTSNGITVLGSVKYLSTTFYDLKQLKITSKLNCGCKGCKNICTDAMKSLLTKSAAETYAIFQNNGAAAEDMIIVANELILKSSSCR